MPASEHRPPDVMLTNTDSSQGNQTSTLLNARYAGATATGTYYAKELGRIESVTGEIVAFSDHSAIIEDDDGVLQCVVINGLKIVSRNTKEGKTDG